MGSAWSARPMAAMPYPPRFLPSYALLDLEQVDHEDQRLVGADRAARRPLRAVAQVRRDHEQAATADLHAGHALLPAADQLRQGGVERLAAVPARAELLLVRPRPAQVV